MSEDKVNGSKTPMDGDGGEVPPAAVAAEAPAQLCTDKVGTEERVQDASTAADGDPQLSQTELPAAIESTLAEERIEIQPDMVKFVQMPKSHVNHTYRNFSDTAQDESYSLPTDVNEMTFHEKLYHILSSSRDIYREAIKWSSHGRAFEIVDTAKLSKFGILRTYFGSNIVPQFRKQLHNHGYKQLTTNVGGMEAYYSEFLLRGLPHLLQLSPEPIDYRTLLPDPANEPDFLAISRLYPLPGEKRILVAEARANLSSKGIVVSENIYQEVSERWSQK